MLIDSSAPLLMPLSRPLSVLFTARDGQYTETLLSFSESAGVRPADAGEGFQPEDALQLLNGIYLLRDDGAFSTVDLLQADLSTGEVTLWKWGSEPSYLRTAEGMQKIGTAQPPPGLEGTGKAERFQLSLGAGEFLVLLSDGAAGPETEELIRSYGGRSPKELAASIVGQGGEEEDDRTAAVLKLQPAVSQRQNTTTCT